MDSTMTKGAIVITNREQARELSSYFKIMTPRNIAARWYVPWSIVVPHEKQAINNHSQDLVTLNRRGGLSPFELMAVLKDTHWSRFDMPDDECLSELMQNHKAFSVQNQHEFRKMHDQIVAEIAADKLK